MFPIGMWFVKGKKKVLITILTNDELIRTM